LAHSFFGGLIVSKKIKIKKRKMKWLDESLPRVPHADTSQVVLPCKNPPLKRSKKIPKQVTEKEKNR
jgi:hypothetical protein